VVGTHPGAEANVIRSSLVPILFSAAIGVLFPILSNLGAGACAAEIKVLSANVFTGVLDELASRFEHSSGDTVIIVYETAGVIRNRVQASEAADMTVLPRPMLEVLMQQGRVVTGSTVNLARSAVSVAVRTGTPKPDIGSVEAFRQALSAAASISYPDPAGGGATGVLLTRVLDRLGMSAELKAKTKFPPPGHFAAELLANGEVEMAIAQPMEVQAQPGIELAGLLPQELQDPPNFTFSAGILVVARQPQAAQALIRFLSGPAAVAVLKAKGMQPE
jgi:molybdate transport system substrate-binding protein